MFVDFNRVFSDKPQTELKIPEALVNHLNMNLPTGIKYVVDNKGNCRITTEGDSVLLGGMVYKPTEEHRKVLGKNFTHEDVLNYAYNAQRAIPLQLKKDGYITLNGEEFAIEKMSYNPLHPVRYVDGSLMMYPQPFPAPFYLMVGCEKYSVELLFKRVPNESVHVAAFESQDDRPLVVKYLLNEKESTISFTISYNLSLAKTIKEIVEATSIFNAFVDGKGLFCGQVLTAEWDNTQIKKYDEDSIIFWEKVLRVEEELGVTFLPQNEEIDYSTINAVEMLYQNLVMKAPIRVDKKIESIDGEWDMVSEDSVKESIGQAIYFEFQATSNASILGLEIEIPCLIGIFNCQLSHYALKGKKFTLFLEHENDEKHMYTSILRFKDDEDLTSYLNGDRNTRITEFHDAKSIQEYLNT